MNKYIGNEFQLYGVEEYTLHGGFKEGVKMLHIKNAVGLDMTVCLSRNSDIVSLTYKGINLSFLTPNGVSHPSYRKAENDGWIKHFFGGFLTTCGYENVGSPCEENDIKYPLHGSINYIPVESYSYEICNNSIITKFVVLDESIFGRKIKRIRTIALDIYSTNFSISDEFENRGDQVTPLLVLYHFNFGYPFLKEDLLLNINSNKVEPRNKHAEDMINEWNKMQKPTPKFEEVVYFHTTENELFEASVSSPSEKIGLKIKFNSTELPFLNEWKMMGIRDYALGLEPGNVTPEGFVINKNKNRIKYLNPDEKLTYKIELEVYNL